jgi:alcohol dehydrogenase (NADP+)
MITFTLSSGDKIPAIGLGTWKANESVVGAAVETAIKAGYRHIDCAAIYLNEGEIGQALKKCIQDKLVTREELWITSKLWNSYHASKDVEPALKNSLSNLCIDYLDLYLMHWPIAFNKSVGLGMPGSGNDFISLDEVPLNETWEAMEALVGKGLVRNIGVSNFSKGKLEAILKNSKIKPAVNQIECHPFLLQDELANFCKNHNIHITAYSPLGSPDRPKTMKKENELSLLNNEVILEIANKYEATPAQILISWQIHRGNSVIPKSTNETRIIENLMAQNIQLTSEDMQAINSLDKNYRYVDASFWAMENSPYTIDKIWR